MWVDDFPPAFLAVFLIVAARFFPLRMFIPGRLMQMFVYHSTNKFVCKRIWIHRKAPLKYSCKMLPNTKKLLLALLPNVNWLNFKIVISLLSEEKSFANIYIELDQQITNNHHHRRWNFFLLQFKVPTIICSIKFRRREKVLAITRLKLKQWLKADKISFVIRLFDFVSARRRASKWYLDVTSCDTVCQLILDSLFHLFHSTIQRAGLAVTLFASWRWKDQFVDFPQHIRSRKLPSQAHRFDGKFLHRLSHGCVARKRKKVVTVDREWRTCFECEMVWWKK